MSTLIPPPELRFMGEDEAGFVRIGDAMVQRIGSMVDLEACRQIVDIGCGYGRVAAGLARSSRFTGRYDGFDLLPKHLAWCNEHLGGERMAFHVVDIHSERYNPRGTIAQHDVRFPVTDGSADLTILTSVFTHMYPRDLVHYLDECRRLVSTGGHVYATFFVINDRQSSRPNEYPLPHRLDRHCRYMSKEQPLHVIAYRERWLRRQFALAGLRPVGPIRQGTWSGEPDAFDFQDTVLLAPVARPRGIRRWFVRPAQL